LGCFTLAQEAAEVAEVLLISGGFLALVARPFLFEFGGSHGSGLNSAIFSRLGMAGLYRNGARTAMRIAAPDYGACP
jgi:hypothetical protein